jgi:hypothetical protein
MGLNIRFVKRPSVGHGIHLIVDDGCEVNINNADDITELQRFAMDGYNDPSKGRYLLYFNKCVTDVLIEDGPLNLYCPTCGNHYELTPEDYAVAFMKFLENKPYA